MISDRRYERFAQIVAQARREIACSFDRSVGSRLLARGASWAAGADESRKHAVGHDPWILARCRSEARVTTSTEAELQAELQREREKIERERPDREDEP